MDVSICILTHNQPLLLPLCVAACLEEIDRARVGGEVLVIDNASADRYPETLRADYPQIRVIRNERNLGFSAGNNRGIRASRGRYVLILNDDAVLQPGSLERMLRKFESDARIGALGPKLLNTDGTVQRGFTNKRCATLRSLAVDILYLGGFFSRLSVTRGAFTSIGNDEHSARCDEIAGACMFLRRTALHAVGLFDEDFYFWFEDADLCWRIRERGWEIFYVADALVTHYGSASLDGLAEQDRGKMYYTSQMLFLKKHWSPLRYFAARILLIPIFVVRAPLMVFYRAWYRHQGWEAAMRSARVSFALARWLLLQGG